MARLADRKAIAHIRRGHETQRAHEGSGAVGENVTVEVGRDDDVVGSGLAEEFVDHRIHDLLFDADPLELRLCERLARLLAEEPVRLRQHVALVRDRDPGSLMDARGARVADSLPSYRDLARHVGDPEARTLGNALDGFGNLAMRAVVRLLFLDVQVFGVLPNDHQVDLASFVAAPNALDRSHVRV